MINSVTAYLRFGIALVVQFMLVRFVISSVGTDDYGLWTLAFSVLGIMSLADFGFTTGVVRFVAEAKALGDRQWRNRVVSTTLAVFLCLSGLTALVVVVLALFYSDLFEIPADLRQRATILLLVLAIRPVLVTLPLVIFKAILFGEQHIALTNVIQVVTTIAYGIAAWLTLSADFGIVGLAIVNVACYAVEHLAYLVACCILVPDLSISPSLVSVKALRNAASVSLHQFVVNVGDQILLRADPIIVKLFLLLHDVALYGVALKVAENALLLLKQGVHALGPWVAEMKARGETERIGFVLISGSKFTLAPGALLGAITVAFAAEILDLWVGTDFRPAATVLVLLMIAMVFMVPQAVAQSVFTMTGLHRLSAYLAAIGVLINIGLSIAFVRPFGLSGVAAATLISAVAVDVMMIVFMARRYFGKGFRAFTLGVFLPALGPGVPTYVLLVALKALFPPNSLLDVLFLSVAGMALYTAFFCRFSITLDERRILRERVLRLS